MSDIDLLIAGAGGGLAGALRAAQFDKSVAIVEANEHYLHGNNTSLSTAMIPAAGSRFQREAGVEDSVRRFLTDIHTKTGGDVAESVAQALAGISAELVEWLADHVGVPIELPTDFHYPGHSAQRVHTIPERSGAVLLRQLNSAVREHSTIDLLAPCTLTALRQESDHFAARVAYPDGNREEITAAAVLLASNGYAADPELVARYQPDIATALYHGSEYSTGDALRIGTQLGATTGYLDAYQGHAALSAATRTLVTWTTVMHGAVVVNTDGRRFGNESTGYSEYAATLAEQPEATGWLVFDTRIHEFSRSFTDYQHVLAGGAVRTAHSIAELAETIGAATDTLRAELAEATAVADGHRHADRFGREHFEQPLAPPYKAVRIIPALFHTQGGLMVNEHAQVLTAHDTPIPGLYAAGGAAVGMSGHGAAGYLAGNGLLPALGLAYLGATHSASRPCRPTAQNQSRTHRHQTSSPKGNS